MKYNAETGPTDGERTSGYEFMKHRIRKILLVCCSYDGYILEEDGHIEQQINQEYIDLNMSNPPALLRVSSTAEALDLLREDDRFDFILTMYNVGEPDVFDFAKIVKERHRHIPVVLLTSFSKDIYRRIDERDASGIDYIFSWSGNTDLVIGIIKLIEDAMNAEEDILTGGVQAILLVEDSVRFYSTYLPALYKLILQQSTEFLKDALQRTAADPAQARPSQNPAGDQLRRCRGALRAIQEKPAGRHLGRGVSCCTRATPASTEKLDAGIDLCRLMKADNPQMPVLLQSSQDEPSPRTARELGAGFIAKYSKTLLHGAVATSSPLEFAFGDFRVQRPLDGACDRPGEGSPRDAAARRGGSRRRLRSTTPRSNRLSKWLYSRGLFLAGRDRSASSTTSHFDTTEEHRAALVDAASATTASLLGQGVVAEFDPATVLRRTSLSPVSARGRSAARRADWPS